MSNVLGSVPISISHNCSQERLQRLFAPRVTSGKIIIPRLMITDNPLVETVLVSDERMIVVQYLIGERLFTVGVSVRVNGQWIPQIWDDLADSDRYMIRSALGKYRVSRMGYKGEQYCILEALERL